MNGRATGVLVEACVDSVATTIAAERGGAQRVELCDFAFEGGITPGSELIVACKAAVSIPVFVMVRPRGGMFFYSDEEKDVMLRDIERVRGLGVDGLATGALTADGSIDTAFVRSAVDAARGLPLTFHRAFDHTPDLAASLDVLAEAGVDRILTGGCRSTAVEGLGVLTDLVRQAGTRITVIAAGKIRAHNVSEIVSASGAREVHARIKDEQQVRSLVDAI